MGRSAWTLAAADRQPANKGADEVMAVDGKSARAPGARRPPPRLRAWASTNRLVLGQEATQEKSNEITAVPKPLGLLELKGCIKDPGRLEVVFNEDASRIRKGNAPPIMTSLRHLCINRFEQEPSPLGLAKKCRKAAWNDDYLAKIAFG
jgi:hypothetical protein